MSAQRAGRRAKPRGVSRRPRNVLAQGDEQALVGVTVTGFEGPARPAPCVVTFKSGAAAIYAAVNDQRMLSILLFAAQTSRPLNVTCVVGKTPEPGKPRIDLLVGLTT